MKVIIIGGGPAGMLAAISAAKQNEDVILIEKNNSLGRIKKPFDCTSVVLACSASTSDI